MHSTRRSFVTALALGTAGAAGCLSGGSPAGTTDPDTPTERQQVCTEAAVQSFNWEPNSGLLSDPEDDFHITILNRADVAGSVTVSVQFWESEAKDNLQGEIERTVSVGAQSAEDVTITANPPTDETSWASGSVTEQDCRYR